MNANQKFLLGQDATTADMIRLLKKQAEEIGYPGELGAFGDPMTNEDVALSLRRLAQNAEHIAKALTH